MAVKNLAFKSQYIKCFVSSSRNLLPFYQLGSVMHDGRGECMLDIFKGGGPVSVCKVGMQRFSLGGVSLIHTGQNLRNVDLLVDQSGSNDSLGNGSLCNDSLGDDSGEVKRRKKLKGKRAVVRWLRFFRYKKKKDYERMTPEEKVLYKLKKAHRKQERLIVALDKIKPKESSETTHDPEILTPEEHFYYLKMGEKCKNYVPVGRRGIFQGVILNMHLHWKKHQTLKVIVKTFTPDEVKEIAVELARLSGGIVLDIQEENSIIMYRGKNYYQPPTEIMSPRITLSRKKALDKSKYRDALRAVKKYIPKLEQEIELLQAQAETRTSAVEAKQLDSYCGVDSDSTSNQYFEGSNKLKELLAKNGEISENDDSMVESDIDSDSSNLSDIFELDTDPEDEEKSGKFLYMDTLEKIPVNRRQEDFEHLSEILTDSQKDKWQDKDIETSDFDDVDRVVLRAAALLKKKWN